jgi:hypothetical protein
VNYYGGFQILWIPLKMAGRWKFTAGSFLDGLEFDDRQDLGVGNTFLLFYGNTEYLP